MSAPAASPAERTMHPRDTLKYSELKPEQVAVLRLDASLSETYGSTKSKMILQGYEAFRKRSGVIPGPVVPFGGVEKPKAERVKA